MLLERSESEPLQAHRLFASRRLDETREIVARKFCGHRLTLAGADDLDTVHNHVRGNATSLNFLRYGADVEIEPGELTSFYLVQVPIAGAALVQNGRQCVEASRNRATVLNPTRHTRMRWSAGCAKLLLQIDRDYLHGLAERVSGHTLPSGILFETAVAFDAPDAQTWRARLVATVARASQDREFYTASNPHHPMLEEALVLALLTSQPSNVQLLLGAPRNGPSGRQIRRALDFMHANLARPMTMSEVADVAGCSLRSLQLGFRRSFGTTPLAYLRRQRLMLAHVALSTGDPTLTVASAAAGVGYDHMGRFAQDYRALYGCLPSATLGNASRS